MKALIQRVNSARVEIDGDRYSEIGTGILTLLGVGKGDTESDLDKILDKILKLRIFNDESGKMNLSIRDICGQHLIVSQFTLYADTKKGTRPSFISAEEPEKAKELYLLALTKSKLEGIPTKGGIFGAEMKLTLINDGPVTLMLDSN